MALFSMMCTSPAGQVAVRALQWCPTGTMCSEASSAASSTNQTSLRAQPPLFNPRPKILFLWQQQSAVPYSDPPMSLLITS